MIQFLLFAWNLFLKTDGAIKFGFQIKLHIFLMNFHHVKLLEKGLSIYVVEYKCV